MQDQYAPQWCCFYYILVGLIWDHPTIDVKAATFITAAPHGCFCRVGTHPSGAASILSKSGQAGSSLGDWLGAHPEALGAKLASWQQQQGQGPLPFLMKVGQSCCYHI
jgi:hypothetical protein